MCKEEPAAGRETNPDMDLEMMMAEAGQFGRYQWRALAAAAVVAALSSISSAEYIFTTARINTRCLIPECEMADTSEFSPVWLAYAVPSSDGAFDGCHRYVARSNNITDDVKNSTCPVFLFDQNRIVGCEQYVYQDKNTMVYDLELACDEWRRSLIGFAHTFGTLLGLPITGYISDRWGRRVALVFNTLNTAWLGLTRYWIKSYIGIVISELAQAALGYVTFSTIQILMMELAGPQHRVRVGAALSTCFSIGMMMLGLLAWAVPNWRSLTLTIHLPYFLGIFYIWILPESIRWYKSKGRFDKVEAAIKNVARVNKKILSEKVLLELKRGADEGRGNKSEEKKEDEPLLIVQVFRHKRVLIRCITLPILWISMTLAYYGMSINAVNMVGNRYLNYVLVSAVEVPGFWLAVAALARVGRRPVLAAGYWLCALCMLGYIFISKEWFVASLLIYLVGKVGIAVVGPPIYIYTAELLPTRHRHSLVAFCLMVGRIGSIVAPLTPALGAAVFPSLPFVLFGGMALLAGCLVLAAPETRGAPVPDTMRQADDLGRGSTRPS